MFSITDNERLRDAYALLMFIVNNDFFAIFALERKYGVGIIRCAIGKASASLAQRRK